MVAAMTKLELLVGIIVVAALMKLELLLLVGGGVLWWRGDAGWMWLNIIKRNVR